MRTVTKEYIVNLKKSDTAIGEILRTPPPDFTELDKTCVKFENWIREEHKKDREIMRNALKAAGR